MDADKTSPSGTEATLARIEAKLDVLIAALAADEEPAAPAFTLDGEPAGREREPGLL